MASDDCRYCRKSRGLDAPAEGFVYEDDEWLVSHAPVDGGHPGTLILSSRRHFLDMTEMSNDEVLSFAAVIRRLVPAIKSLTGTERVYTLSMMAGVPHFHTWLIPQPPDGSLRAFRLLGSDRTSSDAEVIDASRRLRASLAG